MTGYGCARATGETEDFLIEIRALNHRYFEYIIRLPKNYSHFEDRIRKFLKKWINRGRIEVNVIITAEREKPREIRIDKALAIAYDAALKELGYCLNIEPQASLELIAGFPDVINVKENEPASESSWQALEIALRSAVEKLLEMRAAEGSKLQEDIIHRIDRIEQIISSVKTRAPLVVEEYRKGLRKRIADLLGEERVEEVRIMTEVGYFAEKTNITEEIVRLTSHLVLLRKGITEKGSVGRKLDFILQEIQREINTIGSKGTDIVISEAVIEVKSELEKIREQVQNIE